MGFQENFVLQCRLHPARSSRQPETKKVEAEKKHILYGQELFEPELYQEAEACNLLYIVLPLQLQHRGDPKQDNSLNAMASSQSEACLLEPMQSPVQDTQLSTASRRPAPLCRLFWKAGNYDNVSSESLIPSTKNYLHVHPKFLHSNATSHKWAFGAVAELIDNAVDEIQNGATFVMVDKISDPRDKSPALLFQDDGDGMDPEAFRRCMSFGFSEKMSEKAIGKYGNGFKTSTMRLRADAIVFSRQMDSGRLTQSIGLLSYTYLCHTGMDRIVIPMIDYEYVMSTASWKPLCRDGNENFYSNTSIVLQWSPFSTEAELLKQFDNVGYHGTKIIIYNLWFADDGALELDFNCDPEDIRLKGTNNIQKNSKMLTSQEHIGNQYQYSLRVYLSILYLQLPQNFKIILRGKVVEHHNIACDLKFPEFIVYRPQTRAINEVDIITTIGFLKEAPDVNIHGFNVYHKNRLILPFWQVVSYKNSRGRGVVGVLEANFAEPIHNKQDFERSSLFQRLETRLKYMTWEYWDYHCGLIGYQIPKRPRASLPKPPIECPRYDGLELIGMNSASRSDPTVESNSVTSVPIGSVSQSEGPRLDPMSTKKQLSSAPDSTTTDNFTRFQLAMFDLDEQSKQEVMSMMLENKKLQEKCSEYVKREEKLIQRVLLLKKELKEERNKYAWMLHKLQVLGAV